MYLIKVGSLNCTNQQNFDISIIEQYFIHINEKIEIYAISKTKKIHAFTFNLENLVFNKLGTYTFNNDNILNHPVGLCSSQKFWTIDNQTLIEHTLSEKSHNVISTTKIVSDIMLEYAKYSINQDYMLLISQAQVDLVYNTNDIPKSKRIKLYNMNSKPSKGYINLKDSFFFSKLTNNHVFSFQIVNPSTLKASISTLKTAQFISKPLTFNLASKLADQKQNSPVYTYDLKSIEISPSFSSSSLNNTNDMHESTLCRFELGNIIQSFDMHYEETKIVFIDEAKNIYCFDDILNKNSNIYLGKLPKLNNESYLKWVSNTTSIIAIYINNEIYIYDQCLHSLLKHIQTSSSLISSLNYTYRHPDINIYNNCKFEMGIIFLMINNDLIIYMISNSMLYSPKSFQLAPSLIKYLMIKKEYANSLKMLSLKPLTSQSSHYSSSILSTLSLSYDNIILRNNIICLIQSFIQNFYSLKDNHELIIRFLLSLRPLTTVVVQNSSTTNISCKDTISESDSRDLSILPEIFLRSTYRRYSYLLICICNYDLAYELGKTLKDKNLLLNLKFHAYIKGYKNLAKKIQKKINLFLEEELQIQKTNSQFKLYKNIRNLDENEIDLIDQTIQNMMVIHHIKKKDIDKEQRQLFTQS